MPTVARLNVVAVKGTRLAHPEEVDVGPAGIVGDRAFFLVDESGTQVGGTRHGPLIGIRSAFDAATGVLTMELPDGSVVRGDAGVDGRHVTSGFYGRSVTGRVVDGPWAAVVSSFTGRALRLVRTERVGDAVDVEPVTMVSLASVRDLAERGRHAGDLDPRRFRMNLELDGCHPYEEDTWDGRSVAVGGAVLRIHGQIPRCVVTTLDPSSGVKDWDTLTQIAKYRPRIGGDGGLPFGVYSRVVAPGRVRVGDQVRLIENE
jgi:uncharacterized protein YcbX